MLFGHSCGMTQGSTTAKPLPRRDLTAEEARPERIANAIMVMMESLSEYERELVLQKLTDKVQAIATPRAGTTLDAVVITFKHNRGIPLTVQQIKSAVADRGVSATPKEIYNALGYLARKEHVRRMSYGQYVMNGIGVVTSDNLGVEPRRNDDN